jgi:hypothetical protein
MRWTWWKRREVDPDAVEAVRDAAEKLADADMQLARAEVVGERAKAVGRPNHFAERWAAALKPRGV